MINTPARFFSNILLLLCLVYALPAGSQSYEAYIKNYKKKEIPEATEKYGRAHILTDTSLNALLICDSIEAFAFKNGNYELLSVVKRIKGTYSYKVKNRQDEALLQLKESLAIAEKHGMKVQQAKALHHLGYCYYINDDLENGLKNFIYADHLMKEIGYQHIYDISRHLYNLAMIFSNLYNIDNSNTYLNLAIKYGSDNEAIMAAYNSLGQNYRVQKKYDTALIYCKKSLEYAVRQGDSLRFGLISGNIGEIYKALDSTTLALYYLSIAEQICNHYGDYEQGAMARISLAEINFSNKQYDKVKAQLEKVAPYIHQYTFRRKEDAKLSFYMLQAEIYKKDKQFALASVAQDSIIKIKANYNATEEINMLKNIETSILIEKFNSDLLLSESIRKKQQIFFVGSILIFALLTIVIYLFYSKKLQKKKQNLSILELKQKHVESELQHAKIRLQDYVQSLKEKNILIEELKMELDDISSKSSLSNEEKEDVIQKMREATILTEKDWHDFKTTFEKVHINFFTNILKVYPDLSVAELRILSLLKLHLSVDDMASMLGVSPDSVKRTFRRIRTKVDLPNQISLENMVNAI